MHRESKAPLEIWETAGRSYDSFKNRWLPALADEVDETTTSNHDAVFYHASHIIATCPEVHLKRPPTNA